MKKVAVLGASAKPERYAHKAQKLLMEKGHEVYPVNPAVSEIMEVPVLDSVPKGMDVVTVYLGEKRLLPLLDDLLEAAPQKVIFNPGAESKEAMDKLQAAGVEAEEACTLVLLNTGMF